MERIENVPKKNKEEKKNVIKWNLFDFLVPLL